MAEPKSVIATWACATSGGPFKTGYNLVSGIAEFIPVDVFLSGCPPRPEALLHGLIMLQQKIDRQSIRDKPWYDPAERREIPVPILGPDLMDGRTGEFWVSRMLTEGK